MNYLYIKNALLNKGKKGYAVLYVQLHLFQVVRVCVPMFMKTEEVSFDYFLKFISLR